MSTFENTAILKYGNTITKSNTVHGTVAESVVITKTAIMNDYVANDDITYVISILNSGTVNVVGANLTDNLGAITPKTEGKAITYPLDYVSDSLNYFINGKLQGTHPTVKLSNNVLAIGPFDIAAGSNILLIYETKANKFAPLDKDSKINSITTLSATTGIGAKISSESTVTVDNYDLLSITKSIDPKIIASGEKITYTFVIQNAGNTASPRTGESIIITDTFSPVLTISSVKLGSTPWTLDTQYKYVDGVFETIAGSITVPPATFIKEEDGSFTIVPGVTVLTIEGTPKGV